MIRILLVAALLALPALAHAAPVCVGPSVLTVCANVPEEPLAVDAGEVRAENGTAIAIARGDVAAGVAGPVVFVASWHFAQEASSDLHRFSATLSVLTRTGVGNATSVTLDAPAGSAFVQSGTLRVTVADDDLLASGGQVILEVQQYRLAQSAQQLLGRADSRAPVTVVATPEARTVATADLHATDTFTVGTVRLKRGLTDVVLDDGATVVATGTALRLVLDGTLNMDALVGPFNYASENAYVTMMVGVADGPSYMVSRHLAHYSCSSACSVPGHAGSFSLEMLLPGDALDARRPFTVTVWAGENHSATSSTEHHAGNSDDLMTSQHVAYVAGL